jgi:hypothetical protein
MYLTSLLCIFRNTKKMSVTQLKAAHRAHSAITRAYFFYSKQNESLANKSPGKKKSKGQFDKILRECFGFWILKKIKIEN